MATIRQERIPIYWTEFKTKQELLEHIGYSKSYARAGRIQHTQGFKEVMSDFVKKLEEQRDAILAELELKDLSEVKHTELVKSLDVINKNILLATGKPTENTKVIVIPSEIAEKNETNSSSEPDS